MLNYRPTQKDIDPSNLEMVRGWAENDMTALEGGANEDVSAFALIAKWHWAKAIISAKQDTLGYVVGVDWAAWRLGLEYADLFIRSGSGFRRPLRPSDATFFIEIALSRTLQSQVKAAQRALIGTEKIVFEAIRLINLGSEHAPIVGEGDLDAIGLLYEKVTGFTPKHAAFQRQDHLTTRAGIEKVFKARKRYANARLEQGGLLAGYSYDLIPLEAIFLNTLVPEKEKDPSLALLAQAIAATDYPDDPVLEGYDARLARLKL